jgi:CHAD domain-containing protein
MFLSKTVTIQLDQRFQKKLKARFGKYDFEVGILKNVPHKKAVYGSVKNFHGGPARRTGAKAKNTVRQVSHWFRQRTNYLRAPFHESRKNDDIIRFTKEFFKMAFGKSEPTRLRNLVQAIIRNPILRRDYGPNKMSTVRKKGFDRYGIDTGQLFKNITAKVTKKNV